MLLKPAEQSIEKDRSQITLFDHHVGMDTVAVSGDLKIQVREQSVPKILSEGDGSGQCAGLVAVDVDVQQGLWEVRTSVSCEVEGHVAGEVIIELLVLHSAEPLTSIEGIENLLVRVTVDRISLVLESVIHG